jgi:hypothetical protein
MNHDQNLIISQNWGHSLRVEETNGNGTYSPPVLNVINLEYSWVVSSHKSCWKMALVLDWLLADRLKGLKICQFDPHMSGASKSRSAGFVPVPRFCLFLDITRILSHTGTKTHKTMIKTCCFFLYKIKIKNHWLVAYPLVI